MDGTTLTLVGGVRGRQSGSVRYTIPVRVSVDVHSHANVVEQAKAELQRKFDVSEAEWQEHQGPFLEEHFGHALGILLTSDAVQGSVRGILETLVKDLEVVGFGVRTSEVKTDEEG